MIGFYSPLAGFIVIGIGITLRISILGPLLTKLVPKYSLGKSFGLIRSLKDFFGMLVFLYISNTIKETHSYQGVIWLLIIICSSIFTLALILYILSKRKW